MPLRFPSPSQKISDAFAADLSEGAQTAAAFERFGVRAPASDAVLPGIHQVFYVPPKLLRPGTFQEAAKPVSWRRIQGSAGLPSDAEIDLTQNPENSQITSRTRGPFSHAPVAQLPALAVGDEGEGAPLREVRMLRIPEIKLMAIWLHSADAPAQDTLIPLAPCLSILIPGQSYSVESLSRAMRPAIEELARQPEEADS